MKVTFYTIKEDPKNVTKTIDSSTKIGTLTNISIEPTETMSILRPKLIMAYSSAYINANYCYIDDLNRYYYCSVALAPGKRAVVSCVVDPLFSFKTDLLKIPVTVIRSESAGINYTPDKQLPVDPTRFYLHGHDFFRVFRNSTKKQYSVLINSTFAP